MRSISALPAAARPARSGFHPVAWAVSAIATQRQRARLAALEPHMIEDLGLSTEAVRREAARPFWDLPTA